MPVKGRVSQGFSLIEVMVALVILATSLIVLLDGHNNSTLMNARAKGLSIGNMLAQQKITETQLSLDTDGFDSFDAKDDGDFGEDHPGFRWESSVKTVPFPIPPGSNVQSGGLALGGNVLAQQLKDVIKEVKVIIFWASGAGEESVELVSHVMNFEAIP